jgi:pimeloyl-ACP methyl ester carboxylesterase
MRVTLPGLAGPLAGLRTEPADVGWDGPPSGDLLLVPGFTGSKEDFLAVLRPLGALGWRVTTYDQRGQFESAGPDSHNDYTLDAFAADLLAVVGSLPGPTHVVGHSFGGVVARQAALAEGATGRIASLVLLCSGPGPVPEVGHEALAFMHHQLADLGLATMYDLQQQYEAAGGSELVDGEVGDFLRHRYLSNNAHSLSAMAGHLVWTPDRTGELAALAASGLLVSVVYGESDDAWPIDQQDAVASACGTSPIVIANAGHSPAVDQPEVTAQVLDALARS